MRKQTQIALRRIGSVFILFRIRYIAILGSKIKKMK